MLHPAGRELGFTAAKTLCVLLVFVAGMRLLGKRQLGQMNVYDIVLVLLLANAVQNAMTRGSGRLSVGLTAAATLILVGRGLSAAADRLPRLGQRLVGGATLVIHEGKLVRENLRREGVTEDDLYEALREHGVTDIRDVRLGVLEVDGTLSIVERGGTKP